MVQEYNALPKRFAVPTTRRRLKEDLVKAPHSYATLRRINANVPNPALPVPSQVTASR